MIKLNIIKILLVVLVFVLNVACNKNVSATSITNDSYEETKNIGGVKYNLPSHVSYFEIDGETYFADFLDSGGANSDDKVVDFLVGKLKNNIVVDSIFNKIFGCSDFNVKSGDSFLVGRNFDFTRCRAGIIKANPNNAYKSIGTVNIDFIGSVFDAVPDTYKPLILYYAVLDGMNEKGVSICVNMIEDNDSINQNKNKDNITTTTAVRLVLDKASDTDEAIELLSAYNMNSSKGWMCHFFISDSNGKSVVVEYVNNEMIVIENNILTNFYIANGEKYGIGSTESHRRYEIIETALREKSEMDIGDVFNLLSSVSKKNFTTSATTEWSIVFDKKNLTYNICSREDFSNIYSYNVR